MANFYASIQGNRSERTCMGTKDSGIYGHIRGWNIGGRVDVDYCEMIEDDKVSLRLTGGSNGGGNKKDFGIFCLDRFTKELVDYNKYFDKIREARDEFKQLRYDDKDFAKQYKKGEFWSWYEEQGNINTLDEVFD